ncbi:MAG: LuxR C-terminal-related transcriptional regulator [Rhodopirellula sp. JB044]|uniref:PAS and helix-turn-helix domain-containing protein n=1 Tax=Rhodopirellula sp. JB044 TaxID=3342844 RepID=UPI00370C9F2F
MTRPDLSDIDFVKLLDQDPDLGLVIVSEQGEIVDYSTSTPSIFGVDPAIDFRGKTLSDVFEFEFADERMQWISEVLQTQQPLRVDHLYNGRRMVSTILPMRGDDQPRYVAAMTKRDGTTSGQSNEKSVVSGFLDLGPLSKLTKRELEVLILLGHGHSVPDVARKLYRSPRTVEQHKASIGRKLGVSAIADIARIVAVHGLKLEDLELERVLALRPEYRHEEANATESP